MLHAVKDLRDTLSLTDSVQVYLTWRPSGTLNHFDPRGRSFLVDFLTDMDVLGEYVVFVLENGQTREGIVFEVLERHGARCARVRTQPTVKSQSRVNDVDRLSETTAVSNATSSDNTIAHLLQTASKIHYPVY